MNIVNRLVSGTANVEKRKLKLAPLKKGDGVEVSGAVDMSYVVPDGWRGKHGANLAGETVRLRFSGNLNGPVVFVLGGISADRFVSLEDGNQRGWWGDICRHGGGIDLKHYCVVGADFLSEKIDNELSLCPEDFALLFKDALTSAGTERVFALVGSSFGGMIGLSFARQFPEYLDKLVVISAAHHPHPMAQAWRVIQRRIIRFAAKTGDVKEGIALARQLAMTTYRTPEEFAERFDRELESPGAVSPYLTARGDDYAARVSPSRYLTLSAAIDRHLEEPENIRTDTLVIGAVSDRLAPMEDLTDMQSRLGGPSEFVGISSPYGHDAFLKEPEVIGGQIKRFFSEQPQ